MHSQDILKQIKNHLFINPQKCIQLLSSSKFLNNIFQSHLQQLINILQSNLTKKSKQNKNITFNQDKNIQNLQLNTQLIVCLYSTIIIKSTAKSIVLAEQNTLFNSKLAIDTLTKIHKNSKQEEIKQIVSGLLLKIPSFQNHKIIVKDIQPQFISLKTMKKAMPNFKNQCPNLIEEKLNSFKQTKWGDLLCYKPFKLDQYLQLVKKLQQQDFIANDSNNLIKIRQAIRKQYFYLEKRIKTIEKQQFFIFQFCQKFTQVFRIKLSFSKALKLSSSNENNSKQKILSDYSINQLRLKILLQARNYLYKILCSLINKLGSYWTRKIKWLYDFIIERIQIYGLEQMGLNQIQQAQVYIQKLNELKLIIKITRTYLQKFQTGFFPQIKLKNILFNQEYSFYKMIEALLYNQYEFLWQSDSTRIVNYQKNRKITEQVKNKQNLIKTVNVNSKSLNINPHYDLVFQKVIEKITAKYGSSYQQLKGLISQALRLIHVYYKSSQSYYQGGNLITMIQNCKNTQFLKSETIYILNQIKKILYPNKGMVRTGLQLFCQEVFVNYISKKKQHQINQQQKVNKFNIRPTGHISIFPSNNLLDNQQNPQSKFDQNKVNQQKNIIKKTKSEDMVIEGWNQDLKEEFPIFNSQNIQKSQIFYSIKQGNESSSVKITSQLNRQELRFGSIKQNQQSINQEDDMILIPQF